MGICISLQCQCVLRTVDVFFGCFACPAGSSSFLSSFITQNKGEARNPLDPPLSVVCFLPPRSLFIDGRFDFCFDSRSSKTFNKSFDSFAILSLRNDLFRNVRSLATPSFRVDLLRMVRACILNGEMMEHLLT